jgi:FkbM family methyltransferase
MNEINKIFSIYEKEYAHEKIPLDKLVCNLTQKTILLFGAGSAGIGFLLALRKYGINPIAFLDNDSAKQGRQLEGLPVYSPASLSPDIKRDALVIFCINTDGKRFNINWSSTLRNGSPDDLVENMYQLGYKNIVYYSYFWRCYDLFCGEEFPLPSCSDIPAILENKDTVLEAYNLFTDDVSKEIFLRYLSFRLLNREIEIPTTPFEKKYFFHSFLPSPSYKCFVDGGAFNGNTLIRFLSSTSRDFSAYYGFEPDAELFKELKAVVQNEHNDIQEKLHLYQNALFNKTAVLPLYSLGGPGTLVHPSGLDTTQAVTLDSIDFTYPPTYIKLNVEGCEYAAIEGGKKVIESSRPVMSIRLLKIRNLWEIPLLLKRLYTKYRFYLRSYMGYLDFFLFVSPSPASYTHT